MITKSPLTSKTLGGLLLLAVTALLRASGHPVDEADAQLREAIETTLNTIGLLVAIYGRFTAQGPLRLGPPPAAPQPPQPPQPPASPAASAAASPATSLPAAPAPAPAATTQPQEWQPGR